MRGSKHNVLEIDPIKEESLCITDNLTDSDKNSV